MQITRSGRTHGKQFLYEWIVRMQKSGFFEDHQIEECYNKVITFCNIDLALKEMKKMNELAAKAINDLSIELNNIKVEKVEKRSVNPYSRSYKRNRFK